mgnify:FL=1
MTEIKIWDRSTICSYLFVAINGGAVRYSDILKAMEQADLYQKKNGPDQTIQGHLDLLIPRLGFFEDLEKERQKLDKDRKSAFRNAIIGTIAGAFIGLFGSVIVTYYTIVAQERIANDDSKLSKELSLNLIQQLGHLEKTIQSSEKLIYENLEKQTKKLNTLDTEVTEIKKELKK